MSRVAPSALADRELLTRLEQAQLRAMDGEPNDLRELEREAATRWVQGLICAEAAHGVLDKRGAPSHTRYAGEFVRPLSVAERVVYQADPRCSGDRELLWGVS